MFCRISYSLVHSNFIYICSPSKSSKKFALPWTWSLLGNSSAFRSDLFKSSLLYFFQLSIIFLSSFSLFSIPYPKSVIVIIFYYFLNFSVFCRIFNFSTVIFHYLLEFVPAFLFSCYTNFLTLIICFL